MDANGPRPSQDANGAPLAALFQQWNRLLEILPVGVYVCDPSGEVVHCNPRAVEIWGGPAAPSARWTRFTGALVSYGADGRPLAPEASPVAEVLGTGATVRDREGGVGRANGERIDILSNAEPLRDDAGALIGAVCCVQNLSGLEPRHARPARRESRDVWVQQVFQHSPVATYWTDAEGRILSFNAAAVRLWGRTPDVSAERWCGSHRLWSPDGQPMPLEACPLAMALGSGEAVQGLEARFERPDGSRGAFMAYPTLLHDSRGVLVGAVNMLLDITDRKQAEDRQKILVDELNHRVKNTLASVQSLAAHSLRGEAPPKQMRERFEARLLALSNVHNQLAGRSWEDANLQALVEDVLAPYRTDNRVVLEGGPLVVSARAAVTLCMLLHELATNAVKYGALSAPEGQLHVSWRTEGPDLLVLEWRETGGPPAAMPVRKGFGTRFIAGAVASELGGRLDHEFEPAGLRCRIEAPL